MQREFLVRGNNVVSLVVKEILQDRLYVCCRRGPDMTVGRKRDWIRSGAVLVRNVKLGRDGVPLFMAYDGGFYDAMRALGVHVDDRYEGELEGPPPAPRALQIERIRGCVAAHAQSMRAFAYRFFDALREAYFALREPLRVWRGDASAFTRDMAEAAATRLAEESRFFRGVSVAPFSRRALPNAADDLDAAVVDLRAFRLTEAFDRVSMAERSLRMTFVRRTLEPAFTAVSRHKELGTAPDAVERPRLLEVLTRSRAMLFEAGKPLDVGFRRQVILPTVAPKLSRVVDLLRVADAYDPRFAYDEFSAGIAPL